MTAKVQISCDGCGKTVGDHDHAALYFTPSTSWEERLVGGAVSVNQHYCRGCVGKVMTALGLAFKPPPPVLPAKGTTDGR